MKIKVTRALERASVDVGSAKWHSINTFLTGQSAFSAANSEYLYCVSRAKWIQELPCVTPPSALDQSTVCLSCRHPSTCLVETCIPGNWRIVSNPGTFPLKSLGSPPRIGQHLQSLLSPASFICWTAFYALIDFDNLSLPWCHDRYGTCTLGLLKHWQNTSTLFIISSGSTEHWMLKICSIQCTKFVKTLFF